MKLTSSSHNHTTLSDGQNTPEEMAEAAIAAGFTDFGFSDHCDPGSCGIRSEAEYIHVMRAVQARYAGRLRIAVGLEQDYFAPVQDRAALDYIIASVHYLRDASGAYCVVDGSLRELKQYIDTMFGGDVMAMVRAYYALVAEHALRDRPEIIGHLDLVKKNNKGGCLFDEDGAAYRQAALETLDICAGTGAIFEINTGGLFRGYCAEAYPARFLLEAMCERGARVTVNADAHCTAALCYAFEESLAMLREIGFSSVVVLENGRFTDKPL